VLVGARLGALVAALAAEHPALAPRTAGLVLWSPFLSGRRFRRELGLLASAPPATNDADGVTFGGFLYPTALLDELGKAELKPGPDRPRRLVLLDDPTRRAGALYDAFTAAKWDCTMIDAHDTRAWIDESSELATPPADSIAALTAELERWAAEATSGDPANNHQHTDNQSRLVEENSLGERALRLEDGVLAALHHHPRTTPTGTGVLLLNSGVERGVGPGGAWVEAARSWATEGLHVLRLDHASTGDSGTRPGQQPHDVYGASLPLDVNAGAAYLRNAGCTRVVAVGICASAYSLLERGPGAVDHAVVINPQLYRIGMPAGVVEEATNHTKYRLAQIDRRLGIRRKVKRVKALLGHRHPAFAWLTAFTAGPTKLTVVFGSDDRGLQFLQREGSERLDSIAQSGVELAIIEGLNHALHDRLGRDQVLELITKIILSPQADENTHSLGKG
jgi:hypothetical protein